MLFVYKIINVYNMENGMQSNLKAEESVIDRLVDMISCGELARAQRVREVMISERLGVSRIPLREAMGRLESQGVLEARERGGMNVKAFSAKQINEICRVRAALEPIAMRDAVEHLSRQEHRIKLNAIIEEMKWAAEHESREDVARADIAFHRFLIELSGNDLIRKIWSGLELQLRIIFRLELYVPTNLDEVVPKHLHLRDVLLSGDLEKLDSTVADHVWPEFGVTE